MSLIDREGTFRGDVLECGVTTTKNGFPQFVARLRAEQYYDEDEGEWIDWGEYEQEIMVYMVLFGSNGQPTLNAERLQKVYGWDGRSLRALNDADYSGVKHQWRVQEKEYNGNTSLQVVWIDVYDAEPGRRVRKLEAKELAELDKKYAAGLSSIAQAREPVKAKKKKKSKPKIPPGRDFPGNDVKAEEKALTKEKAWDQFNKLDGASELTEEQLAGIWVDAISEIAPTKEDDALTGEEWSKVLVMCSKKLDEF